MLIRKALAFTFTTLVVVLILANVNAQENVPLDKINEARILMQRGDHDQAIEILKAYTKENPKSGEAWTTLANAYHVKGDYETALEINRKALKFPGYNLTAKYNEACALSLLGQVDDAHKALKEAIAMGFLDYDHIDADTDLDAIRKVRKIKGPAHHTYESMKARNGMVVSFKIVRPKDFDENKIYPAVIIFPPGPGPRSADWALDQLVGQKDDPGDWLVIYPVAPDAGWYTRPSLDAFADFMATLQDEYSIEGKFHIAGFGTGARVATTYSLVAREFVQSLTTFSGWHWRGWEDEDVKEAFANLSVRLVVGGNDKFGLPMNKKMKKQMSKEDIDVAITVIKKNGPTLTSVRGTKILEYIPRKQ